MVFIVDNAERDRCFVGPTFDKHTYALASCGEQRHAVVGGLNGLSAVVIRFKNEIRAIFVVASRKQTDGLVQTASALIDGRWVSWSRKKKEDSGDKSIMSGSCLEQSVQISAKNI